MICHYVPLMFIYPTYLEVLPRMPLFTSTTSGKRVKKKNYRKWERDESREDEKSYRRGRKEMKRISEGMHEERWREGMRGGRKETRDQTAGGGMKHSRWAAEVKRTLQKSFWSVRLSVEEDECLLQRSHRIWLNTRYDGTATKHNIHLFKNQWHSFSKQTAFQSDYLRTHQEREAALWTTNLCWSGQKKS